MAVRELSRIYWNFYPIQIHQEKIQIYLAQVDLLLMSQFVRKTTLFLKRHLPPPNMNMNALSCQKNHPHASIMRQFLIFNLQSLRWQLRH